VVGGYHLTSYTDGVLFDIDATGIALRVGWTESDSSIGILAADRNGNGTIDDGSELFGTATRKRNGDRARFQKERKRKMRRRERTQALLKGLAQAREKGVASPVTTRS